MNNLPRTVTFRFDGPQSDVEAVINMLAERGVPIAAHHAPRYKRRGDPGVFWDGQIGVPEDAPPVQADATRLNGEGRAIAGGNRALPRRRHPGR